MMIESVAHPIPDNAPETRVAELEARLSALERSSVDSWAANGVRSDLSGGYGVRWRHGLLPDGVYGYEVFTEDGKRCRNGHWAGEVFFFAGSAAPQGCIEAAGQTGLDGTTDTYLYLWRAIGTTYGGTGQSSFAAPNLRGRVAVGKATSGTFATLGGTGGAETNSTTLSTSNLPSHTHAAGSLATNSTGSHTHSSYVPSGSGASAPAGTTADKMTTGDTGSAGAHSHTISGSTGSTGSGTAFTTSTLQPYLILLPVVAL